MTLLLNILFLLLSFLAEILGTVGGFGSSVFFVPFANFFFPFQTVLGLTAIFHLSSNISKITLFKDGLDKRLLLYIGLPSILFVIIGGYFSKLLSTVYLEIGLGVLLISMSLLFLLQPKLEVSKSSYATVTGGALSGFTAGLLGTGGAIRGLTMAAFNMEKSAFIATSAAIDFGIDFTRTIVYFFNGFIRKDMLIYVPFLLIIGFTGTWVGKKMLYRISQDNFKRISLFLILVIGIVTFFKSQLL